MRKSRIDIDLPKVVASNADSTANVAPGECGGVICVTQFFQMDSTAFEYKALADTRDFISYVTNVLRDAGIRRRLTEASS